MENPTGGPINPIDLETSANSDLIQQALDSGRSMMRAYTSHGEQIVQEDRDRRNIYQPEIVRVSSGPRLAFADWVRKAYQGGPIQPELDQLLAQAGIFEVCVLAPLEKEIMGTRKVVDKPGALGIGKKTHQESYVAGTQQMTIGEAKDGTAGGELAVALYYYAGDFIRGEGSIPSKFSFADAYGRPGNFLYAEIALPQSLGDPVSNQIRKNPRFVRDLIDAFVRQKHSRGFVIDSWDKYAKPPYQVWDARPVEQRKFYYVDLVQNPQYKQLSLSQAIERALPY